VINVWLSRCKQASGRGSDHEGHSSQQQPQQQPRVEQQQGAQQQHAGQDLPDNDAAEGLQRHPYIFNIHPLAAGCFPATPVHGVQLYRVRQQETPLWFTVPLLLQMYCQRKHIQRMAMTKTAAALQAFYQHLPHDAFPQGISSDRFRQALSTALDHFTEMWERASSKLRPSEGLASACTVCKQGHLQFLLEQDIAGHAVFAAQDTANAAQAGPPTGGTQACPAEAFTSSASGAGLDDVDSQQPSQAAATAASNVAGEAEEETAAAGQPTGSFAGVDRVAYAVAGVMTVVHSVFIDGLQKMRHFAKAGGLMDITEVE
jgi:hypothetical protein